MYTCKCHDFGVCTQTASAIANEQKHRQVQASLQDALATKKEEARQLLADKTAALKEISDLQQQLKEGQVWFLLLYLCLLCVLCLLCGQ